MSAILILSWIGLIIVSYQGAIIFLKRTDNL